MPPEHCSTTHTHTVLTQIGNQSGACEQAHLLVLAVNLCDVSDLGSSRFKGKAAGRWEQDIRVGGSLSWLNLAQ